MVKKSIGLGKLGFLLGIFLALGMITSSAILGWQFKNFRQPSTIKVKGLAESHYKSDYVQWKVGVNAHEDDYKAALSTTKSEMNKLKSFLANAGFTEENYVEGMIKIESVTREYRENDRYYTIPDGYSGEQDIVVTSKDITKIQKAINAMQNYRADNNDVTFSQPEYLLSNLEDIKRELIAKATADAKVRADDFT